MHRNVFFILIVLSFVTAGCAKKQKVAISIGDIEVTAQEFESELKDSRYPPDSSGRKAFLTQLVRKKLILKEAELMGLDKNPQFLKDIQYYWEQGLLKLALAQKSKELMLNMQVTDNEISSYYQAHKDTDFAEAELSKVYDHIKWFLFQEKQTAALANWVDDLERRNAVKVDNSLIGIRR
jgi:hypothetical protein